MQGQWYRSFFLALGILLHVAGTEAAGKTVTVTELRSWSSESYTRVVVGTDGPVEFTRNRLSDPDRLYFDIKNSRLSADMKPSFPIEDGILMKVRIGQFSDDTVRVVLDLQSIEDYKAFLLENPNRLVIDVYGKQKTAEGRIRKVIIDPGHGGADPGAVGPNGLLEKDVVLEVAKHLGGILKEKHGLDVLYTRESDVFIPLEERTAIANTRKGDLFISLHVNASRHRGKKGIETYFLNWTTDGEAMRVAARENAISVNKMKEAQNSLQMILMDLEREKKKEESMKLAYNVQTMLVQGLGEEYGGVVNLGVKYALFYVLVGSEMPSVLVEMSFISNHEEEKRLSEKRYRMKMAEAIAEGIGNYAEPSTLVERTHGKIQPPG